MKRLTRGVHKNNDNRKFQSNTRKKYSASKFNGKSNFKRKYEKEEKAKEEKRLKLELEQPAESSESEEEIENPLTQLLSTFGNNISSKHTAIVNTDSESAEEESESDDNRNKSEDSANENEESDLDKSSDEDQSSLEAENEEFNEKTSDEDKDIEETVEENEEDEIDQECLNENEDETSDEDKDIEETVEENEEDEIDQECLNENEDETELSKDPFVQHLSYDLSDNLVDTMRNAPKKTVNTIEWPLLGKLQVSIPTCEELSKDKSNFTIAEDKIYAPLGKIPAKIIPEKANFSDLGIKTQIHEHIQAANAELDEDEDGPFTEFQSELFSIINNYQDLYFTERSFENGEEIRFIYCLHSINHVLKTRTKVLHHNARLSRKDDVPEEFRDQGLVRPKVLIIVPFRNSCLKIVENLIALLVPSEAGQVINKKRFIEEFTGGELFMPKKNPKPEDYELNFAGNCDDNFKIGLQVTKKSLKLYADFYSSDIIIASPVGLRLTIGAEGEIERDHDFLASIELLILDQTELFLMQNWDHLIHILDHLHIQPKKAHGTDFARVRTWALNGWSRYYRQTLIFSSLALPEINAIFNRRCANYSGTVRTINPIHSGTILNVHVQVPQVFRRFEADSIVKAIEGRFEFFLSKVLPQYKDTIMKHTLIYVPSYFDFVKIRNYFKREDIGFVQICEYTKDPKIARARDYFFHGEKHFMLYSERFHYFRRIRLKGIRHVIFYQPPVFPHFYSEICNFMTEANMNKKSGSTSNMTVTVIYSKYDSYQMAAILGSERLEKMAASSNNFHMFTSSDR